MLEANRSRARMAKAWETPGRSRKSSRRAASVVASEKISSFAADMEVEVEGGDSPSGSASTTAGTGKRRSSRGESGGSGGSGSADKRQRR